MPPRREAGRNNAAVNSPRLPRSLSSRIPEPLGFAFSRDSGEGKTLNSGLSPGGEATYARSRAPPRNFH